MCITYPKISSILADGSRALCRCTLLFCSLFQFPMGKQSFQYVSGETRTCTLSRQSRTYKVNYQFNFLLLFFILLTHERSHSEAYWDIQPSLTLSEGGGAKSCLDHRFRTPPAYTSQFLTLYQFRAKS